MSEDSDLPAIELDRSRMETPRRPPASRAQPETEPKIELDWNVPHGQMAARHSDGIGTSKPIRVAGQVQVKAQPQARTGVDEGPEPGKFAPSFRAITFDGKLVDLTALRGKKVWLTFYRYATCPLCNLHIAETARRYQALKAADLEVIAVFDSRVPEFHSPGGLSSAPFPMISDSVRKLYDLYATKKSLLGVLRPSVVGTFFKARSQGFKQGEILGDVTQMPSSFLIDPNGMIRKVHHGKTAVDYLAWSEIEAFTGARLTSAKFGISHPGA